MKIHFFFGFIIPLFFLSCGGENPTNTDETNSTQASENGQEEVEEEEQIVEAGPDDTLYLTEKYFPENYESLYGFRNQKNQLVIEPKFKYADPFYGDYAPVVLNNVHGFCNKKGELVFELKKGVEFLTNHNEMGGYYYLSGISEGMIIVKNEKNKYGVVNFKNETIAACEYDMIENFNNGLALVSKNNLYGYINTKGKIAIEIQYTAAHSFSEEIAAVKMENDLYGFINKNGEEVITGLFFEVGDFSNGLCVGTYTDYEGYFYFNTLGEIVIPGPFTDATLFYDNAATVRENGVCKTIDKKGKTIKTISCEYFDAEGC